MLGNILSWLRARVDDGQLLARSGNAMIGVGHRQIIPFGLANVAAGDNATVASSTPVVIGYGANGAVAVGWVAPRAGSLTGLSAALSGAAAGSNCIVGVYKNGTLMDSTAVVTLTSAGSDTAARTTLTRATYTFDAGDVITVRIRTGSGWSATTVDLGVSVEIET